MNYLYRKEISSFSIGKPKKNVYVKGPVALSNNKKNIIHELSYQGEGAPKLLPRWKEIRLLVFGWTRLSEIPRDTLYIYVSTSCKNSSKRPQVALHCLRRVASLQRIALYVASEGNKRQPPRSLRVNSSSSSFPDSTLSCIYDLQSVTKVYTHPLNTIYYGRNVGVFVFILN